MTPTSVPIGTEQRLSAPTSPGVDARGVTLTELGKPACIVFLLVIIVLAGLLLNWMAGQITATLKTRPIQQEQLVEEAVEPEPAAEPDESDSDMPMP